VCVTGVWPEGSDGTDINALVRSHNRKVIALADDFCKVHLFQYPCSRPKVCHTHHLLCCQIMIIHTFPLRVLQRQAVVALNVQF